VLDSQRAGVQSSLVGIRELTVAEKLAHFVERWHDYGSSEEAGRQSFLIHLLECYGIEDIEPGQIFEQHPVRVPERNHQTAIFADTRRPAPASRLKRIDFYLPGICVWEMKRPKEDLDRHHAQVLEYWSLTRPRYMVLCNFHEFWIYDTDLPDGQLYPVHKLALTDLPQNPEALTFLRGEEAHFSQRAEQVTRKAAEYIGKAVRELIDEAKGDSRQAERVTRFTLECVFAMFAEDTHLVLGNPFKEAMGHAQATGDLTRVYDLFDDFSRAEEYDRRNRAVPYVNGPLYDGKHPKLKLDRSVLAVIYNAANEDWSFVRPEVFGSIFEQALHKSQRHKLGAHFTGEADIRRIVEPTVVRPWRDHIKACHGHQDCEALMERMRHYHVLDPACGSGNFLYIVYREMKRLERALATRWEDAYNSQVRRVSDERQAPPGPYFTVQQLHGIDKDELAVQLTRVVLWIGQQLAARECESGEPGLPLSDLSANIVKADALLAEKGGLLPRGEDDQRAAWFRPPDDGVSELAIVGNPPFMGRHKMRLELTDAYVDKLHAAYADNRNGDLVTYWYPQALATLRPGERAGFVSTNSIAQNESREASLDRIVAAGGTIYDAWKSYPWPGESAVHVSIVNWMMGKYEGLMRLQDNAVMQITPLLTAGTDVGQVRRIEMNLNLSFEGVQPGNKEFVIDESTCKSITRQQRISANVLSPYLIGRDVNRDLEQRPSRFIVDFGQMGLEDARKCTAAFKYLQEHVYPARTADTDRKTARAKRLWWQFKCPAPDMRAGIGGSHHYLVAPCVSPYVLFVVVPSGVVPDHQLKVFAFDSYYHFGVLQSRIHEVWAWARGSTLEERLRYTNTTIFETFPFPLHPKTWPKARQVKGIPTPKDLYEPREVPDTREALRVSRIAEELYAKRQMACKALNLGLTKLYNFIKGKSKLSLLSAEHQARIKELIALHEQLSDAVNACYGWPIGAWRDDGEVLTRLLELNRQLTS